MAHQQPTNGVVFYRGPSMIDGKPIVAIATGLTNGSTNAKTGNMVQTWILREDIDPMEAANNGEDVSICGDCVHRGTIENGKNVGRSCYVTLFQAPLNIWNSYRRGIYPTARNLAKTFAHKAVRLGSYGDPAAVPLHIWTAMLEKTSAHNGYTHQWKRFPELAVYVMASADSHADKAAAKMLGFRTFRVTAAEDIKADREKSEIVCPASAEKGNVTNCAACRACGGNTAKARADVVIRIHGAASKVNAFKRLAA